MIEQWEYRADLAEAAINERHIRRVIGLPGANLGVVTWPPRLREKLFLTWHYWWQAQLIDCAVDAYQRRSTPRRARAVRRLVRGHLRRSTGGWTANNYYDDMAWLSLAIGRAVEVPGVSTRRVRAQLAKVNRDLELGVNPHFGVLPWRRGDMFFNSPANGPGGLAFLRSGHVDLARSALTWMQANIHDPQTGLIQDGVRLNALDEPTLVDNIYSYNQGTVLGLLLELAAHATAMGDTAQAEADYAAIRELTHAVAAQCTDDFGVINTEGGGGDGGCFKGILVRYLAAVATTLPIDGQAAHDNHVTREIAARLVIASAESVWRHRLEVDGLPVFGADWTTDAGFPQATGLVATSVAGAVGSSTVAERDLSVQISGWMLMEAACRIRHAARARSEKGA